MMMSMRGAPAPSREARPSRLNSFCRVRWGQTVAAARPRRRRRSDGRGASRPKPWGPRGARGRPIKPGTYECSALFRRRRVETGGRVAREYVYTASFSGSGDT